MNGPTVDDDATDVDDYDDAVDVVVDYMTIR